LKAAAIWIGLATLGFIIFVMQLRIEAAIAVVPMLTADLYCYLVVHSLRQEFMEIKNEKQIKAEGLQQA